MDGFYGIDNSGENDCFPVYMTSEICYTTEMNNDKNLRRRLSIEKIIFRSVSPDSVFAPECPSTGAV